MSCLQLIINPGSTSTKLALYDGEEKLLQSSIEHKAEDLHRFEKIGDQVPYRLSLIHEFMAENKIKGEELSAVVGRGGLVYGLRTGGYAVNDALAKALVDPAYSSPHASNLGGLLAKAVADEYGIPAYIYDAVTSGDLSPVAKITGIPEITRQSFSHVLNSRAQAIRYAASQGKRYEDMDLIVFHLGGGTSASVHRHGTMIDSVGDDDGQFSPERSGCVPALELTRLCFSGKYTKAEMDKKIRGRGGMYAHLGTSDCREIERRIEAGDRRADEILQAQAYQIAKTIGLLSVALKGHCDAIILTGGLAYSKLLTERIKDYAGFLAPIVVIPGENEMEALAQGGLRLLSGQEKAKEYHLPERKEL